MNLERWVEASHVERVQIVVLVGHREHHCFEGIPSDRIWIHLEHTLTHRHRLPRVIQSDRAIGRATDQKCVLNWRESHGIVRVNAPRVTLDRLQACLVPDVHALATGRVHWLARMMVYAGEKCAANNGLHGLERLGRTWVFKINI